MTNNVEKVVDVRDTLRAILREEKEVHVFFTKKNGEYRDLRCTLNTQILPPKNPEEVRTRNSNPDTLSVWDLDANNWRSFNIDTVERVTFADKELITEEYV